MLKLKWNPTQKDIFNTVSILSGLKTFSRGFPHRESGKRKRTGAVGCLMMMILQKNMVMTMTKMMKMIVVVVYAFPADVWWWPPYRHYWSIKNLSPVTKKGLNYNLSGVGVSSCQPRGGKCRTGQGSAQTSCHRTGEEMCSMFEEMLLSALILICFIQSRGCSLFSTSHSEHSVLRLAIVLGRRVLVYRWSSIGFLELYILHRYQHNHYHPSQDSSWLSWLFLKHLFDLWKVEARWRVVDLHGRHCRGLWTSTRSEKTSLLSSVASSFSMLWTLTF